VRGLTTRKLGYLETMEQHRNGDTEIVTKRLILKGFHCVIEVLLHISDLIMRRSMKLEDESNA